MGMPVKLSDELVQQARDEAKSAERSITAQIEHWAQLGRFVESALRHDEVMALKRARGDADVAFPQPATRKRVYDVLQRVARSVDLADLGRTLTQGRTVYQSDPAGSGAIQRVEASGKRALGRIVNRRFIVDHDPAAVSKDE
jgi:hypothetical protein